jgi:hypothetical protein
MLRIWGVPNYIAHMKYSWGIAEGEKSYVKQGIAEGEKSYIKQGIAREGRATLNREHS